MRFSPLEQVIATFREGGMVVICDDAERENEGDLAIAAECITPEKYSFMMRQGRGLVCTSIDPEIGRKLQLPLQIINNNSAFGTPFAPSVSLRSLGAEHSPVSARVQTVHRMIADDATPDEFASPGSVYPLLANPAGVVGRDGQTEGSYDLARLAGLKPAALICEVLREDGTMMRGAELEEFALHHSLPITSVAEIFDYRVNHELLLREEFQGDVQTRWGEWKARIFYDDVTQKEHLALIYGDIRTGEPILTRVHSECLTGDVFGSVRCDCGPQLDFACDKIKEAGAGILLYLRQEGRGIGLSNKLKAYELQDRGRDTVEANVELGFEADERDYRVAVKILRILGISRLSLMTNNPDKIEVLRSSGVEIASREPIEVPVSKFAASYMETKKTKLGHLLT
ncbi:GTP cyclohydrolase II [bacterium]|nr:GTP cyclohydrolase II [bacterium]